MIFWFRIENSALPVKIPHNSNDQIIIGDIQFTAIASTSTMLRLLLVSVISAVLPVLAKLPKKSHCAVVCPGCDSPSCKCPEGACWPGKSVDDTPYPECACFASLGFCKDDESPVYTKGKKCPSCWPSENKACDCFAVLGFCDAAPSLPVATTSGKSSVSFSIAAPLGAVTMFILGALYMRKVRVNAVPVGQPLLG